MAEPAIAAVYPQSQVRRRIIHQIRSSTRFASYKTHQAPYYKPQIIFNSC